MIDLLLTQPMDNVHQLCSFDEVLACLIRQAQLGGISSLSKAVARSCLVLPKTIWQFAFDEDTSLADPIWKHADCIADGDLNELERLLFSIGLSAMVMACKAAGLRWATVLCIICTQRGVSTSEREREELEKLFESLSLAEFRLILSSMGVANRWRFTRRAVREQQTKQKSQLGNESTEHS